MTTGQAVWVVIAAVAIDVIVWPMAKGFARGLRSGLAAEQEDGDTPPDVADSPAWDVEQEPAELEVDLEMGLACVIAAGDEFRSCRGCGSHGTVITPGEYTDHAGELLIELNEKCTTCNTEQTYHVPPMMWVAMEASRIWEHGQIALDLQRVAGREDDLRALDQQIDPDNPNK